MSLTKVLSTTSHRCLPKFVVIFARHHSPCVRCFACHEASTRRKWRRHSDTDLKPLHPSESPTVSPPADESEAREKFDDKIPTNDDNGGRRRLSRCAHNTQEHEIGRRRPFGRPPPPRRRENGPPRGDLRQAQPPRRRCAAANRGVTPRRSNARGPAPRPSPVSRRRDGGGGEAPSSLLGRLPCRGACKSGRSKANSCNFDHLCGGSARRGSRC
jgi:hypothetical protein